MTILWKGMKVTFAFFLMIGLVCISGLFCVLLYAKIMDKIRVDEGNDTSESIIAYAKTQTPKAQSKPIVEIKTSAMITAPLIKQNPELPAGCEITSLTMLLQFSGIQKTKMELAAEMKRDETAIVWEKDGTIKYWGNPNVGFVGDITRNNKAFGIYHTALFPLLKSYIPSAVDLTNQPFQILEKQIAHGTPVIVWTTIDYQVPDNWIVWDTSLGPIETTFFEHAVLLVGYDESSVYVNDPLSGKKAVKISKTQFIASWDAMGKQGLSYNKSS